MAAIAYLANEDMLEYHRSKGHRFLTLWRTSERDFKHLEKGDLLFLVDRSKNHPLNKEKGIIAFGKMKKILSLDPGKSWREYGQRLGFHSEELFLDKIAMEHEDQIPRKIQLIELSEVLFINAPIFIGEVTQPLNKNLEAFTYLSDTLSQQLLIKAKNQGIDPWFEMISNINFSLEMKSHLEKLSIRSSLRKLQMRWTDEQDKISRRFPGEKVNYFSFEQKEGRLIIYMPASSLRNQYYILLGMIKEIEAQHEAYFIIKTANVSQEYQDKIRAYSNLRIEEI